MTSKAPSFDPKDLFGTIQTGEAVQTGCWMCLKDGLAAPAANHVVYLYQGTSYCGDHLYPFIAPQEEA